MMEEWKEYKLGELADIQTGPFGSQLHQHDYVDAGTPCIMPTNIGSHLDIQSDRIAHVKAEDVMRLSKHCVKTGDIIYSRRGDIEKCAFIRPQEEGWLCGTGCLRIRTNSQKANSHFIAYQLSTKECKKWIVGNAVGTTMLNLNSGILKELPLYMPNRQIQDSVVAILKSLDDKIEVNRKINENLEQQAQALFKSWFVDFEPFKNGEFVESELGMIPKGWRVYCLSEFLPVITGKKDANVAKGGPYPFFSCSQDFGWTDDYSFEGNAILVAGNGDFNVKTYNGKFEAYQRTYVLIPHNPQYTSWLFYAVKYHLNDITSAARGSVIKFITKGNLADFKFPAPQGLDKAEIIEKFDCFRRIIASNEQESRRLAVLRDTLLPKLMSGEIKVNEIEK